MIKTAKKFSALFLALALFLTGCTQAPPASEPLPTATPESASEMTDGHFEPVGETITLRVMAVHENDTLLLADPDGTGIYRNKMPESLGFQPGQLVAVTYDGSVLEIYPSQLSGVSAVALLPDGFDDRCRLYLDVLDKLWTEDAGLNGEAKMVSIDLKNTSLSPAEQSAVAWHFAETVGLECLEYNYLELKENGYLVDDGMYWEDGVLLSIEEEESSDTAVTFNAEKWRSGLGAIFFTDCTAERRKNGSWSGFEIGGFAIS